MNTIVILIILAFIVYCVALTFKYYRGMYLTFGTHKIELKDLIIFPNTVTAKYLIKRLKTDPESIAIEYAANKYVVFDSDSSKEQILNKLEDIQEFFIEQRYAADKIPAVQLDTIDSIILDLWTDYADKNNFRDIVKKKLNYMLEHSKISDSTYNILYRRFFNFDRSVFKY